MLFPHIIILKKSLEDCFFLLPILNWTDSLFSNPCCQVFCQFKKIIWKQKHKEDEHREWYQLCCNDCHKKCFLCLSHRGPCEWGVTPWRQWWALTNTSLREGEEYHPVWVVECSLRAALSAPRAPSWWGSEREKVVVVGRTRDRERRERVAIERENERTLRLYNENFIGWCICLKEF